VVGLGIGAPSSVPGDLLGDDDLVFAKSGAVLAEVDRHDAKDSAAGCDRVQATAGLDGIVEQLVQVYREALAARVPDARPQPDWWVGQLEMAARALFDRDDASLHAANLVREVHGLRQQVAAAAAAAGPPARDRRP
jgi:hypothetical protein